MIQENNIEAFLALLRGGLWDLSNVNYDFNLNFNGVDWEKVFQLSEKQSVTGLIAEGIDHIKKQVPSFWIPQEWALQFIGNALQLEQHNAAMNSFIATLIGKMRDVGIYALLLKGQGVAQCYERPLWRANGDMDFFLSDDNYQKAKEYLQPLVSSIEPEGVYEKHLGMTINEWVVELHGTLHVGLSARVDRMLDNVQYAIFHRGEVRSWMNGQTQVFLPAANEDVVYVFVHILQHFYKGGIGLRQICDWCRLLYTYKDSLNYGLLEQRIKRAGLMSEWKAFYNLASRYLGMPDYGEGLMVHDSRFDKKADRIMEFILKSGNMGHNRGSWLMEHDSWLTRQYVVRKAFSMFRRIGDLINHARIFPLDSLRFFPRIMFNGLRSAVRGE